MTIANIIKLLTKGGKRPPLLFEHKVVEVGGLCVARQHVPWGGHLLAFEGVYWAKLNIKAEEQQTLNHDSHDRHDFSVGFSSETQAYLWCKQCFKRRVESDLFQRRIQVLSGLHRLLQLRKR